MDGLEIFGIKRLTWRSVRPRYKPAVTSVSPKHGRAVSSPETFADVAVIPDRDSSST